MRTLLNHPVTGFRANGQAHNSVEWQAQSANHRANQIGMAKAAASFRTGFAGSQSLPPEPDFPDLADDDFPFAALIQFVRQMRK